jgi:plasmid stabilization system protein ParE
VRVRFTPSARRDFLDALAYVRDESPAAAEALAARAGDGLAQLRDFPDSGRVVPEFPDLMYREVLVHPYRFIYRVADDAVWIVGVWHDRQLPDVPGA